MTGRLRWLRLRWPWSGTREARRHLEESQADREAVHELAQEVRDLHRENHISARVHAAFRGGGA